MEIVIFILLFLCLIFFDYIGIIIDFISAIPVLIYYFFYDLIHKKDYRFPFYGVRFFVGKQGSGKTMSMTKTLIDIKNRYPNCKIYTNYGFVGENGKLTDVSQLLDSSLYNGADGVVFAIDEIQNEWSCNNSKNFPESILSVITQQRKNAVCILCTSQVFGRVAKPIREQAFKVVECSTIFDRLTINIEFDGFEYADSFEKSDTYKRDHRSLRKANCFIQNNSLRNSYDTFKIIEHLGGVKNEKL